eukprot:scaffold3316_cov94-Skeletonema_marinoi.AAC.3
MLLGQCCQMLVALHTVVIICQWQSRRSEGANCYPALLLDDATFASDAVSMNRRRILLDQLMAIRSLMGKEGTAGCDAAADDSRDVIKDLAKGMTLNKEQLTALSLLLL